MHIFAFGATGFLGQALIPHLLAEGHSLTVASRSGRATFSTNLTENLRVIQANPMFLGSWTHILKDCDAVINLTGSSIACRWTKKAQEEIYTSRIQSTANIVAALSDLPEKILLCANATGYYGNKGETLCTEETPQGAGFLAEVSFLWQQAAEKAREKGHTVLIARFAPVLGQGGMLEAMRIPFRFGLGGRLGSGKQWLPWIHIHDLVRALNFSLQHRLSGVVNICAPHPVTNAQFTRILGQILHRPTPFPVPASVLQLLLGETAHMLLDSQRAVPDRLRAAQFSFCYPDLPSALSQIERARSA